MNGDGWVINLITHIATALLGGGLAALFNALTKRKHLTVDALATLNEALRAQLTKCHGRCADCREELELCREAVWTLRQGALTLQAQVRALGEEPDYQIDGDIPEGVEPK